MNNAFEYPSAKPTTARRDILRLLQKSDVLSLSRDRMLSVRNARESRVHCLSGMLWITEDKRVTDTVLKPNESLFIAHDGLVLVVALEESRVSIEPEGMLGRIARMIMRATGL